MTERYDPAALVWLQEKEVLGFEWTYLWLAAGGVLLVLAVLAFVYLLLRQQGGRLHDLVQHSALGRIDRWLRAHMPGLHRVLEQRFTVHRWHGLALTVGVLVLFGMAYLFVLITEGWTSEETLYAFDQQIYEWLVGAMNEQVTGFMKVATHLGDTWTIVGVSAAVGGYLAFRRHWWHVVSLVLAVGAGAGVMMGLKWAFERSRPEEQLAQAAGHSFPSGHSFMAVALYGFLMYLFWRFSKHDAVRIGATILFTFVILVVGLSRIVLRVHWVSDVAGGFTVGLAWLVCSAVLTHALHVAVSGRRARSSLK